MLIIINVKGLPCRMMYEYCIFANQCILCSTLFRPSCNNLESYFQDSIRILQLTSISLSRIVQIQKNTSGKILYVKFTTGLRVGVLKKTF
jgi:hypothetical protein